MTPSSAIAVSLALASVLCYAVAAALQRRESGRAAALDAGRTGSGVAFFLSLAGRRWWWAGLGATVVGGTLHVAALGFGSVTLVAPIGVTTLIGALALDARLGRRRVRRAEWAAAGVLVLALVSLVALAPHDPYDVGAGLADVLVTVVAAVAAMTALGIGGTYVGHTARAVMRGAAAGVSAGAATGLVRMCFLLARGDEPQVIALVIAAGAALALPAVGILMLQTAYRDAGLDAGFATQTAVDPAAAAAVGIAVLGERVGTGAVGGTTAAIAALVAAVALAVLVHVSPEAGAMRAARGS